MPIELFRRSRASRGGVCQPTAWEGPLSVFTLTWNTGQSSTFSGNRNVTIAGGVKQVVTTGTMTYGLFAGDPFIQTTTGASPNFTLCELGLASISSDLSLTIT
ncbi:hypothetical protein C9F11_45210 (plasmid) [Streptomyces sp. YIM 121038]|uniref:hypothetical protein n=1 Tax=Streptomyces sp. YIM 121038 TaxID=2136401 RepID=UPI001110B66A|nr:hypothetical protein [Streptomyces sp. YIM 121038]QCX82602.1 hypothetical protein C9F11_45210 [Streptomyces sp. YIM 121038]